MVSFTQDIRPLFRDKDVQSMRAAFDLSRYEDVRDHADAIYDRLASGAMPCDGVWPRDRLGLLRQWIDEGHAP